MDFKRIIYTSKSYLYRKTKEKIIKLEAFHIIVFWGPDSRTMMQVKKYYGQVPVNVIQAGEQKVEL